MTRTIAAAGLVIGTVILIASPAWGHTRAAMASDWQPEITSVPDIPGLSWRLYPAGEFLALETRTSDEIVVLGYEDEPYLRFGPDEVEQNLNSPATYLNSRRDGDVALPPRADASAPPEWKQVTDSSGLAWFDHRVHRMPNAGPWSHPASAWEVPFTVDGRRYLLAGELLRVPGPAWWQPLALGLALTAGAMWGARRTGFEALRPAAVVVVLVAVLNLVHLPDEVAALPASRIDIAFGLLHNLLFIGVGIAGALLTVRRSQPSALALIVGSIAVAFHQGFLQVGQLGASQLPTIWPPGLIRLAVALSVAQLLWVLIVVVRYRHARGVTAPSRADRSAATGVPVGG